ncbi:thiaminase /4-amino-5-aminomethyl-2-methylpyrimidine deaminase [Arcticibacter tournemirensis]|uniref:Thiaminase II n=1 Tax=Arcticibacter tournemirensis TaxID=699437 RepID=A0A5M9H8W7_9SPHI|nr:TenA family protein [Arcticibacter tournemirensis]KAA8483372.1 thiaminase II [Arcticibacter tournemirensis]TQM50937.1 thiaminase /4-amino-5-aminomethyl-2-methylpyrimidine deaminase [Arcticibacter tournemirensis]
MNWTELTWQKSEGIYDRIVEMPFIRRLIDGSLPLENFKFYIQQDSNYLGYFGRALSLIAARTADDYVLDYIRFAEGAIVVENALHAGYFNEFGINGKAEISPACHHYTSFLMSTAAVGRVETAMAAVLPCFLIYKKVGDYICQNQQRGDNPYSTWINTYAGEEFGALVQKALRICDEVAQRCTPAQQNEMTEAFLTASRLEWLFWDSAWRLEEWQPVV